jgi:hypothetical protein
MKSKYSAIEIEKKFDDIEHKINKYDVIDVCPTTLDPKFKKYNIFNANVIIKLLYQIKHFKMQSPNSFITFIQNIPGFHLLTDDMLDKLKSMSSSFVGVFPTIKDVPNVFKNGSLALIQLGPFGHPDFIFRSKKKWFYLTGNKILFNAVKTDKLVVGHNVIKPYNMAKLIVHATNDINTQTIEFNIIKSSTDWWLQVFKSTLLDTDDELVEIYLNRTQFLDPFPEIIVSALENATISINLEVIL